MNLRRFGCIVVFLGVVAAKTDYQLADDKDQIIKLGNGSEPTDLDPNLVVGIPESQIVNALFKGLLDFDLKTLAPRPGVAESWQISDDGLVYTFKLRGDAKWSDGKPITAEDFVWSWRRALSPELASEYAYQLFYIKNGKAFNSGTIKDPKQLGVLAKDPQTLVVTLEDPCPFFLYLASFQTLFPVPRHVIEKYGKDWTREGHMVSNGPFHLSEWKFDQHVKLVPNDFFWGRQNIKLHAIYFMPIENLDTEEKSFLAGELHLTNDIPVIKIAAFKKRQKDHPGDYQPYREDPYLGTYYFKLNTTKKPFSDRRVRRAFALTIDRALLVAKVTQRGEAPATSFTPPGIAGYVPPNKLPPTLTPENIAEAKKLLAEAGYPEGRGLPDVEILYNTSENHKKIAIALQQMWKKSLGIEVGLFNQEWKVYLDSTRNLNYDLSRSGWIGDYADANTFLDLWVTNGGNNQTGWGNKAYDQYIHDAAHTLDMSKRYEAFRKAEEILLDELPMIPLFFYTRARLVSKNLKLLADDGSIEEWASNICDRFQLQKAVLVK